MKHRISNINIGVELRKAINKARGELNILSSDIGLIVDKICEVQNIEKTTSRHKQYVILSEYTGIKCFVERNKKNGSGKTRKKRRATKSKITKIDFYSSKEWRRVRYSALQLHGRKCQCCGRTPPEVALHVDHIKPRSKFPELELDINNLQILCEDCNLGKGNKDCIDYR